MMEIIHKFNFFILIIFLFFTSFVFSEGLIYYTCHPMNSAHCDEPDLSSYSYSCEGVSSANIKSGIQTCEDLQRIGCINTSSSRIYQGGGQFYLMNDINCEGVLFASFDFGDKTKPTSILDGRGFAIKNLRNDQGGIFNTVSNAIIKDLKLENLTINTNNLAGTLAKITNNTLIQNVKLDGFSINGGRYGGQAAGGLVGIANDSFFDKISVSSGNIDVTTQDEIGGVLGLGYRVKMNDIDVNNMFIQSNYYHNPNEIGGVVGIVLNSTLSNILVGKSVSFGKMKFAIGGIAGEAQNSVIQNAINLANIFPLETQSTTDGVLYKVGGIVGELSGAVKITNSNNYGDIGNDINGSSISGIVGYAVGIVHLENVFNEGNIFGKNSISGVGNLGACFSKTNAKHMKGLVISTNKDYERCENLRVVGAWAWYCNYSENICPYLDSFDCKDYGYTNYCLVGYGGWTTLKKDVIWVRTTPTCADGQPSGFSCCDGTGPVMCDSLYESSNASFCQAQCSGVYFGTRGYGSYDESPHQSHPNGSIIIATTVDANTAAKCESYCQSSETLIFIGGLLPFCSNIYGNWNYQSNCINDDGVCEDPCNYLNDSDCLNPTLCGDGVCDVGENYDNCPQDCSPPCGLLDSSCTKNSDCCSNNCVNGKCGGEIDCVTDYGFCDLNSDCCSSTCVEGRCLHRSDCVYKGGFCDLNSDCCSDNCVDGKCDSGIKPQYNCTGFIDSNAVVVEGDDVGLTENLEALLIKSELMNSSRKCEYYCRPGFEKGVGVDENKCVLIKGYYDSCDESNLEEGWVIHSGDDRDLTILDNIIPVLSEQNHPNIKCEYYCDESRGWVMRNGRCVPRFATEGICGDANRTYYLNEEFPGWGDLCNAGDALPSSGLILGSREGDFVEWICVGRDVNANCRATRSEMDISDINAILNLKVTKATTRQIDGSIICSKSNVADLVLFDDKGNQISIDPIKVNCGYQSNSFKLTPSIDLNEGVFYSIRASIKRNSPDCSVCSKTVLFTPRKVRDEKIPDNYFPLVIMVLLLVATILTNRKKN